MGMEEMVDRWKTRVDGFDLQWCHVLCVSLSWQISEYIIQAYKNGMFQKVLLIVLDVCVLTEWRRHRYCLAVARQSVWNTLP